MTTTKKKKKFISLSDIALLTLIISIKVSLIDWYYIPSSSMEPTLQISDRVVVDKDAYSLRVPLLETIIMQNEDIERGDIVIFKDAGTKNIFIKRVIGTEGDVIEMNFHKVLVNGVEIESKLLLSNADSTTYRERIGNKEYLVSYSKNIDSGMIETIQNRDRVLSNPDSIEAKFISKHYQQRAGKWVVPKGSIFVMGDNRDNSIDSRFAQVGYVKEEAVKGRASFVLANMKPLKVGNTELNIIPVGFSDFNKEIYSVDPITLAQVTESKEETPIE
ncbi:signal peptidase I [Vibrio coralliirubri]|uniref:signal peptidase I n=1 Tax=Vibrio coralliirubri TaxID=1516159 RepID=UPI002284C903|nr:signal peptidase I [Vibrio coralliirubri]MCY9861055.1 signal peptidase I [Vibrio coralliirubri]